MHYLLLRSGARRAPGGQRASPRATKGKGRRPLLLSFLPFLLPLSLLLLPLLLPCSSSPSPWPDTCPRRETGASQSSAGALVTLPRISHYRRRRRRRRRRYCCSKEKEKETEKNEKNRARPRGMPPSPKGTRELPPLPFLLLPSFLLQQQENTCLPLGPLSGGTAGRRGTPSTTRWRSRTAPLTSPKHLQSSSDGDEEGSSLPHRASTIRNRSVVLSRGKKHPPPSPSRRRASGSRVGRDWKRERERETVNEWPEFTLDIADEKEEEKNQRFKVISPVSATPAQLTC